MLDLSIGRGHLCELYHHMLPALEETIQVKRINPELLEPLVPPEPVFSFYLDQPDSKMYYTCDNLKEYRAYIRDAVNMSVHECDIEATAKDNIVTLVTCSGSGASKQRFFVHGVLLDRYEY